MATPVEFNMVLPWELGENLEHPIPFRGEAHTYNYDRQWLSLRGKNVKKKELLRLLKLGQRAQLPHLFPDSTPEDLKIAKMKYGKAGLMELYNYRLAYRNAPISTKLFIASALANTTMCEMSDDNPGSILVRLLRIPELGVQILDYVVPSIGDLTALAMSCREVCFFVRQHLELWDFHSGKFNTDCFEEKHDLHGHLLQSGGVRSDILVITPITDLPAGPQTPHQADFENMRLLCDTIIQIPKSFKTIVIDQISYFESKMFEMMVHSMPNLDSVTISRCKLLDVTKLPALLDVVHRHPRPMGGNTEKGKNKEEDDKALKKFIRLDFFPFFFRGPNSANRLGSYGITYNEPTFPTPKAVFALIMRCMPVATYVGMDLLSDSSSVWNFVRQLPGPDVLWAVKARDVLITRDHDLAEGKKNPQDIYRAFENDLMAALSGDNHRPHDPPERMMVRLPPIKGLDQSRFWRSKLRCRLCRFVHPLSLFPLARDECWACKLSQFNLDMEDSHLRHWQLPALSRWFQGLDLRKATIQELLANGVNNMEETMRDVRLADHVWNYFMNHFVPDDFNQPFCPPPPQGMPWELAAMCRWRWYRSPAKERFDYRQGGPQREDPCKRPLLASQHNDPSFGAETEQNFSHRWQWTAHTTNVYASYWIKLYNYNLAFGYIHSTDDERVRVQLRLARTSPQERVRACHWEHQWQNREDVQAYRAHQEDVEDCTYSLFTVNMTPFSLDRPLLDPMLHREAYKQLKTEFMFSLRPTGL
ncbi:hypothetical protein N0V88_006491 [Collariella sp. IMI 366227]|nr:hypothetical protein N0V88_006491 [Collariella sp. IMI 366227]